MVGLRGREDKSASDYRRAALSVPVRAARHGRQIDYLQAGSTHGGADHGPLPVDKRSMGVSIGVVAVLPAPEYDEAADSMKFFAASG